MSNLPPPSRTQPEEKQSPPHDPFASQSNSSNITNNPSRSNPRACENCRALKVRCLPAPDDTVAALNGQCQRCAKGNRECVFTAPSRTRRRKRTDVRVKELEREVRALSELLRGGVGFAGIGVGGPPKETDGKVRTKGKGRKKGGGVAKRVDGGAMEVDGNEMGFNVNDEASRGMSPLVETEPQQQIHSNPQGTGYQGGWTATPSPHSTSDGAARSPNSSTSISELDVIDRGLLTMENARGLFDRYVNELAPHYPSVVFPPETTAESVRSQTPTLFLAILAAASGTFDSEIHRILNVEILQVYAELVTRKGEKRLELIQAMLITVVWSYPPERFEEVRFYTYIHMAATMALDIGLGRKRKRGGPGDRTCSNSPGQKAGEEAYLDPESVESRRTLLGCYLSCASVSIGFRRPNLLPFTNWMAESLTTLESSPDAAPTDKRLAAWVRLQRTMEACSSSFGLDDPSAEVSLADPRIQRTLKGFEKQLEEWKRSVSPDVMNETLQINYHVHNTILHEIALHAHHDMEDFKPPYVIERMRDPSLTDVDLTPAHIDSILVCLSSAHCLLDTFLGMSTSYLRSSPTVNYVRMIYSVVILIKLIISTETPGNILSHVLNPESLKVAFYLENLVPRLMAAAEGGQCRRAKVFLMVLLKLTGWYTDQRVEEWKREMNDHENEDAKLIEPLRHLNVTDGPSLSSIPSSTPFSLDPSSSMGDLDRAPSNENSQPSVQSQRHRQSRDSFQQSMQPPVVPSAQISSSTRFTNPPQQQHQTQDEDLDAALLTTNFSPYDFMASLSSRPSLPYQSSQPPPPNAAAFSTPTAGSNTETTIQPTYHDPYFSTNPGANAGPYSTSANINPTPQDFLSSISALEDLGMTGLGDDPDALGLDDWVRGFVGGFDGQESGVGPGAGDGQEYGYNQR